MMFRNFLEILVEIITGRRCKTCKHNQCYGCMHPDPEKGRRCREKIYPYGYEKREG